MFRPDREPRGEDPLLLTKMIIFVVAAAIAVTGMVLQQPMVIFGAIVVLGVGFLLRFIGPRRPDDVASDDRVTEPPHDEGRPPTVPPPERG